MIASAVAGGPHVAAIPAMTACMYASFVPPGDPVIDCPVVVYERHDAGPRVHAFRDGMPINVTFTITKSENVILDVDQRTIDCLGTVIGNHIVPMPYHRYELTLVGLEANDELYIDDIRLEPTSGGGCRAPEPFVPTCETPLTTDCGGGTPPPPSSWSEDSDPTTDENLSLYGDDMNCSAAGGSSSLVVVLVCAAIVLGRRR